MSNETESKRPTNSLSEGVGQPISLRNLSKIYPGSAEPAVDNVNLEIEAGHIVCLVGPSGCGKTTTMRMINRLIEPSSGEIWIGDDNVMALKQTELRRRIGYVIQQVGLFPHMTIASNVALVPRLLGWSSSWIHDRVDELLELVGLDPGQYAKRYPRQLSGGEQQRVGVARALAADPPIMLMDEPFGAVDPITRVRLQDEFLALQRTLRKTIVFVTHDFDEAVKMGDKIAVLKKSSRIAQYDTPARILAAPADDFVGGFVGRGARIKQLHLQRLFRQELGPPEPANGLPKLDSELTLHDALDVMLGNGVDRVTVTGKGEEVLGTITMETITREIHDIQISARHDQDEEDAQAEADAKAQAEAQAEAQAKAEAAAGDPQAETPAGAEGQGS